METSWNVYDYPEPKKTTKTIKGEITITYKFETEVPKDWDETRIYQDVMENTDEYIQSMDEIHDLDFHEVSIC